MEYIREELEKLIFEDNLSYDAIGKQYGCTGANIRKVSKKLGIELPQRRKINESETFNKGKSLKTGNFCLNCGKEISLIKKYCNTSCQMDFQHKEYIVKWKAKEEDGVSGVSQVSGHVKRYLFEKYDNKCCECEWSKMSTYTNNIPLEIHHIDGDCTNSFEENLQLLCPNCHSLTNNFGSLNKDSKRFHRQKKGLEN